MLCARIHILIIGMMLVAFASLRAHAEAASSADFYVAPGGSDQNPGTEDKPFATIQRAQEAVRQKIKEGLRSDITVLLRGGTYELSETVVFGPEDSGTKERSITYAAYPGEKPVLSGALRITGEWKTSEGKVQSIQLPRGAWFQDLYVDGKRQPRARRPKTGYWDAVDIRQSHQLFGFRKGQIANWPDVSSLVVVFKIYDWLEFHFFPAFIDETNLMVILAQPHPYALVSRFGGRYYIENVRAALDQPGEWSLDRKEGILSYWPPEGVDLSRAEVLGASLPYLVSVKGDAKGRRFVENLHIRGLTFRYTNQPSEDFGWAIEDKGAAVRLEGARNCSVTESLFADLGGLGIYVTASQGVRVVGNEFVGTGNTAVGLSAGLGIFTAREIKQLGLAGSKIANNYIHHGGQVVKGAYGIGVETGIRTEVRHNEVHDMPYIGIRLSGVPAFLWNKAFEPTIQPGRGGKFETDQIKDWIPAYANVFEYNHVHHVMQTMDDGGAFYTWGTMAGRNFIQNNLIHDIATHGNPGIYIDDFSTDVVARNNVIFNCVTNYTNRGSTNNSIEPESGVKMAPRPLRSEAEPR